MIIARSQWICIIIYGSQILRESIELSAQESSE
uniref:Uncharacterized protein n=1 Tax=Arundo donax TaxID=35708 RepID=A0A0A9A5B1_ARUDO